MWKALCFLFSSLCLHFASATLACGMNFPRDWFDQPLLTSPTLADGRLDGAMIAKVVREKLVSLCFIRESFRFLIGWTGEIVGMITLKDLLKNPSLHLLKPKNPRLRLHPIPIRGMLEKEQGRSTGRGFESRIFEDHMLLGNRNALSLPSDDQLQAFWPRASHRTTPSITGKSLIV